MSRADESVPSLFPPGIQGPSSVINCSKTWGRTVPMKKDRIIVFLLRRRYLLMALALALAAVMLLAACLPEMLL